MKIAGIIATHNKKPFNGVVTVSDKTGLITKVQKIRHPMSNLKADYVFGKDCIIFAGFGDIHIHAREDQTGQQTYKEEYQTAGDAAINGGVVHCCAMPNTPKPLTTKQDLAWHRKRIQTLNHSVSILNYVGIDKNTRPIGKPGEHIYKLYFGKSIGDLTVMYAGELDAILARYQGHSISFHVEYEPIVQASAGGKTHDERRPMACVDEGLRLLLPLIDKYHIKAKLCHWSVGKESFDLIRVYQKKGCDIVLEVSPLHLLFDTGQTAQDPSLWLKIQMNPSVQASTHRKQLIGGLKDGFIQCLATDRAPHTLDEKYMAFSELEQAYPNKTRMEIAEMMRYANPPLFRELCEKNNTSGAPWLDVYGLVCSWLMREHKFTPQDIARVSAYNPGMFVNPQLKRQFPKKNYGKGFGDVKIGFVGSFTVLNVKKKTTVTRDMVKTKCGWSPLEGMTMPGAVEAVFVAGKRVK